MPQTATQNEPERKKNINSAAPSARTRQRELLPPILKPGNTILVLFQETLNKIFKPSMNPMYYLGAITFFLFWIVLISGVYLLLYYEINPDGAYESVEFMTVDQKYYGGIMRSLHRYGSDGFAIVIYLHIVQVLFSDRFRRYRWVAWVTGALLLPAIWLDVITGYFLVWDTKAQMLAQKFAALFDWVPIFTMPFSRNFVYDLSVTPTLFLVMTFLHITIPMGLLILAWMHCMRISKPLINPPLSVAVVITVSLTALSLLKPALSTGPAQMSRLVGDVEIDWFYLFIFPLIDVLNLTSGWVWISGIALFAAFTLLPWIIRDPVKAEVMDKMETDEEAEVYEKLLIPKAVPDVVLSACTGCNICLKACPFQAISIVPRTDGLPYETQVEIIPELCAETGFCVTACPVSGLSMGGFSVADFGKRIERIIAAKNGEPQPEFLVFVCERSLDISQFLTPDMSRLADNSEVASMVIPCIGFLSAAVVEQTFKAGVKGVMVASCQTLDCHHREGRTRVGGGFTTEQTVFQIEEIDNPNFNITYVSRFAIPKLLEDIDEFIDEVSGTQAAGSGQ